MTFGALTRFAPPLSGREIVRQPAFPNVTLITHHGRQVRFYDDLLKDRNLNPKVDEDKASHSGVVRFGNEPLAQWGACQAAPRRPGSPSQNGHHDGRLSPLRVPALSRR